MQTANDVAAQGCVADTSQSSEGAPVTSWHIVPEFGTLVQDLSRPSDCLRPCPLPLWKRAIDILGASLGLVLGCPLFLLVAVLIKFTAPGPVFFRQRRLGLGARPFRIWKFRTMHVEADISLHERYVKDLIHSERPLEKLDSHYRLIPLGKWLRALAIDELPQCINVLVGEMSLVGPRPDVLPLEEYEPWQRARFDVMPGMTGLWQVSGKNDATFAEMVQLDLTYARQRSLWLDLKILLKTVPALVRQVSKSRLKSAVEIAPDRTVINRDYATTEAIAP
jgi:lipopolysaccharide/colanic/teichoic acid biosynthesis glycosyltransferase